MVRTASTEGFRASGALFGPELLPSGPDSGGFGGIRAGSGLTRASQDHTGSVNAGHAVPLARRSVLGQNPSMIWKAPRIRRSRAHRCPQRRGRVRASIGERVVDTVAPQVMHYVVPTAVETPAWETGHTVTLLPYHPVGAKGVGESVTVDAVAGTGGRGGSQGERNA